MGKNNLRRDIGLMGLMYASLGGMIGSGWLFSSYIAAKQAGPLSIFSWILGAAMILVIAFVYAELSTLFPKSGMLMHISHVGHGVLFGRIWSWVLTLAYVVIPPVEVIAAMNYADNYIPGLLSPETHVLTPLGFFISIIVLAFIILINFFSIRWVILVNNVITIWKILIPAATVLIFIALSCHPSNLTNYASDYSVKDMFTTIVSAGVIFSFFGFRNSLELAGESKNPAKNIPLSLIGSVVIALVVYLGLQFAFLLSIPPEKLSSWKSLEFLSIGGPLAGISILIGAFWWGIVLYADAIISPLGTGLIYGTTASRVIMAAGETKSAPQVVSLLNKKGIPWVALLITFIFGVLFLFPFPSWTKIVNAVSLILVLSYSIGPIVLLQLRKTMPNIKRPFRLRCAYFFSTLAFFICNLLIFWSGYEAMSFLFGLLLCFFIIYLCWQYLVKKMPTEEFGWSFVWWLFPYFLSLWLIAKFGPVFLGGTGEISFLWSIFFVFILSILVLVFALKSGLCKGQMLEKVKKINDLQKESI